MAITITPTEEQALICDSVKRWAEDTLDPREQESFADTWPHLSEMGLIAAGFPEELGGFGGNAYDTGLIAVELGRKLLKAPYTEAAAVSAQLLRNIAPEKVIQIARGEALPILAHDEADAWGERLWVKTMAKQEGDHWYLDGEKTGLIGCPHATSYLVSAKTADGDIKLFEIPADKADIRHYATVDNRSGGELILAQTAATLLPVTEEHTECLFRALDYKIVMEAAEMVGAMQEALKITRDYLLERKQFGVTLSSFQSLQHKLADMFINCEQAYSILLRALEALANGSAEQRFSDALAAKVLIADAGLKVTADAVQMHGGIGVTNEHSIGHYYKRAVTFNQRHGGSGNALTSYATINYSTQKAATT